MTKKDEIFRNNLLVTMSYANIMQAMDEYAEYVAKEAWNERNQWVEYDRGETFKNWFEQFKAKENE
jgi:hypothetical protein